MSFEIASRALVASALLAAACGEPLDHGQVIERVRPLGTRVEVEGDPSRAWPGPGERASLSWLVVGPGEPAALGWAFWLCPASDVRDGPPLCAGPASEVTGQPSLDPPVVPFEVPPQAVLGGAERLAAIGVLCQGGQPEVDAAGQQARCTEEAALELRVSADIRVQLGERTNRNPDLSDDRLELGAGPWVERHAGAPGEACPPDGLPRVSAAAGVQELALVFEGDDREPLRPGETLLDDPRETLQVSHFSTHGLLERQYSFVEATDERTVPTVEVAWDPDPAEPGPDGVVVRFVFVVRDGRGGADWTTRDLCLVP